MRRVTFDLDVMRTFVAGVELGSFAKAATRLGRSTSAVSAQLKKLEDQAGTPLLRKHGRGLALTESGETMLGYARRLLDLNDEAASAIRSVELDGWVRIGVQEDFGETFLPHVLGRFARAYPKTKVEARIARNDELLDRVSTGRLDVALAWGNQDRVGSGEPVARYSMKWISQQERLASSARSLEPIPLVLFEAPCVFRTAATAALDAAGISWRVALTSPSLAGLWAAVAAGMGVTMRTELGLTPGVRVCKKDEGLPSALPSLSLILHRGAEELSPAAQRLTEIVRAAVIDGADFKRSGRPSPANIAPP